MQITITSFITRCRQPARSAHVEDRAPRGRPAGRLRLGVLGQHCQPAQTPAPTTRQWPRAPCPQLQRHAGAYPRTHLASSHLAVQRLARLLVLSVRCPLCGHGVAGTRLACAGCALSLYHASLGTSSAETELSGISLLLLRRHRLRKRHQACFPTSTPTCISVPLIYLGLLL